MAAWIWNWSDVVGWELLKIVFDSFNQNLLFALKTSIRDEENQSLASAVRRYQSKKRQGRQKVAWEDQKKKK